jgi:hypothetical protein
MKSKSETRATFAVALAVAQELHLSISDNQTETAFV